MTSRYKHPASLFVMFCLAWQNYPTGAVVDYAPNALGQATKAGTYATGAQYYPNGALKQFTYGNGIVHSMTQNARQLPARATSSGGVQDFSYTYDYNGNVDRILDEVRGGNYGRWMSYDGLDRLTEAGSCNFGGDCWHRFTYDALDNIKSWKLAGVKDYADYVYESSTNRLTNIRNTAGATVVGLSYDQQGNLQNKNGQVYEFDFGNRLRGATGKEYYRYDGLGRRVLNVRSPTASAPNGSLSLSIYTQAGQLLYQWDDQYPKYSENIYLAGSVVAIRDIGAGNAVTVKYQHTDALGSPVAVTNAQGQVIERSDYEPYGAVIGKPNHNGIGYTGHMMDGATGLTYMQQRYYDQSIGRFLSVDPVTTDGATGGNFNRYWYAANNPYRFIDPDGRMDLDTRRELAEDRRKEQIKREKEIPILNTVEANPFGGQLVQATLGAGLYDTYQAKQARDTAEKSQRESGLPGSRNGPADARRHCEASCYMAASMPVEQALYILDSHEAFVPNPPDENQMDLFNNRVGIELGQQSLTCPLACGEALDRDELIVLPKDRWSKDE